MSGVERTIYKCVIVAANRADVWAAWTTKEGSQSFFARRANVELGIGGRYEMLFNLEAPPGSQGSERCTILSYLPQEMLSFTWNAPPKFPDLRHEHTWVVVQIHPRGDSHSTVALAHLGWRSGSEWQQVHDYFVEAWDLVLNRLVHRFAQGPIDWDNPPR
jgi:uncharacterized protein YndB with AHSA1/START domain